MTASSVNNQLIPPTKKIKNKYLSLLLLIFLRNKHNKKSNLKPKLLNRKIKMLRMRKKKLKFLTLMKSALLNP